MSEKMIRRPVVAGQFYPAPKAILQKELERLIPKSDKKEDAIGVVSPHAGYPYSGRVAGKVFGAIKPKEIYIILGPNHTGRGQAFSLDTSASWQTPLGDVGVDIALAQKILASGRYVKSDHEAHAFEHSIEVQLPFLQFVNKNFKFVPIIASDAQIPVYRDVGRQIAQAVTDLKIGPKVTIIASSDMTHYEPHEAAKKKDRIAIEAMLELDEEKLYQRVREFDISMCGYAPACIMIAAAKALGAKSARLVGYETSAEASGDYSSVVGYAGVLVS